MTRESKNRGKDQKSGPPGPDSLDALCRRHGVVLDSSQVEKLWGFHQLLRERNRELNMTRIHNFENMVAKHYADCMLVASKIDLPSPLLDLGTGAGFPGIPLKIFRPDLQIILVEGRKKRVAFLQEALELLELEGIEAVARKVETGFDRAVAAVITRALEKTPETLKRIEAFLEAEGLAIFMKGPRCDAEVVLAREQAKETYDLIKDDAYLIPNTPHRRRLLVFRKKPGKAATASGTYKGRIQEIQSPANRSYVALKKLISARGIRKAGKAILSGRRLVEEALRDHPRSCIGWITRVEATPPPTFAPQGMTWYRMPPDFFAELDTVGTGHPLLLIRLPAMPAWTPTGKWPDGCTLFVPFQDPENVGSVIRSAAAFGVERVVLLQEAAHPFLPKACRAAGTSLLKVTLMTGPSIDDLETGDPALLALSTSGRDITGFSFPAGFGLLAGLEGKGLPPAQRTEHALYIPMEPGSESLNGAAAVSVALFAWRLKN